MLVSETKRGQNQWLWEGLSYIHIAGWAWGPVHLHWRKKVHPKVKTGADLWTAWKWDAEHSQTLLAKAESLNGSRCSSIPDWSLAGLLSYWKPGSKIFKKMGRGAGRGEVEHITFYFKKLVKKSKAEQSNLKNKERKQLSRIQQNRHQQTRQKNEVSQKLVLWKEQQRQEPRVTEGKREHKSIPQMSTSSDSVNFKRLTKSTGEV